MFRHGDLSFHKTNNTEKATKLEHNGSYTLAKGEHTGHAHVITKKKGTLDIYRNTDGNLVLDIDGEAVVEHPEHKPLTFTTGTYEMKQEQEFDYFMEEVNQVID